MEDILIVVGVVAVLLYFGSSSSAAATVAVVPPGPPVPTAVGIPSYGAALSGGYMLPPPATSLGGPFSSLLTQGLATGTKLGSVFPPLPIPVPPPSIAGGIAGSIGSGGLPLGSVLRPGVSGTATTTINPPGGAPTVFSRAFGVYLQ